MLESFNVNNEMQYQKLSLDEQQQRGILGRLVGVIADFKNPTRNGRRYTEELWDKTFNNPIMKEKFENRCLFGELGHPTDRQEVDMEKIAICMAEPPKKGSDGKLYGVFDILSTPNGRILKTMCDYGCKIGVSSRGSGDTYQDYNGEETVEPDSYDCECWDAVLLPAVKDARPRYVNESLDTDRKNLKAALVEELTRSTEEEQRVMKTTLEELDIDYSSNSDAPEDLNDRFYGATYIDRYNTKHKIIFKCDGNIDDAEEMLDIVIPEPYIKATLLGSMPLNLSMSDGFELVEKLVNPPEKVDNIDTTNEKTQAAENNGADMIHELQESLKTQQELEKKVKSLQEQLSVCYTKEARYSEILNRTKNELTQAKTTNEKLKDQIDSLNSSLNESKKIILANNKEIKTLQENLDENKGKRKSLTESLSGKDARIKALETKISSLTEEYNNKRNELESQNKKLAESLKESEKDFKIIKSQASAKIAKSQQLVEKYKTIAKTAIDKYIKSQATRLGISPDEIKNRLNESYSFKDIDAVCESLQKYKITVNSLPFNMSSPKPMKMTIKESKEPLTSLLNNDRVDDDIDDTLRNIIG